jgi:hypothetical protein
MWAETIWNLLKLLENLSRLARKLKPSETIWVFSVDLPKLRPYNRRMANTSSDHLDLARLRALGRKKPRTKAGQVRQAWPEIRELLAAGHTIGYARLSDYVNQLRRAQTDSPESRIVVQTLPTTTPSVTPPTAETLKPEKKPSKRDPLANVHRSEARRPGFQYRAAEAADEKDLI